MKNEHLRIATNEDIKRTLEIYKELLNHCIAKGYSESDFLNTIVSAVGLYIRDMEPPAQQMMITEIMRVAGMVPTHKMN